jgi:hypothetical protein
MEGAGGGRGGRELAASCGLGSQPVFPTGIVPYTTGIRLQTAAGTPSFDSEGQVQGRLEVRVGGAWVTLADIYSEYSYYNSFQGSEEATVACRQLGNELGYTLVSASKVWREDTDDGSGMAYKVTCAGTESTLDSCTFEYSNYHSSYCDTNHDGSTNPCAADRTDYCCDCSCQTCGPKDFCVATLGSHCGICNPDFSGGVCGNYFEECDGGDSNHNYDVGVSCTFLAPGDECEECVAGKYSGTSGVAACASCTAGSYSTVGAASCQQVRWGG